MEFRIVGRIVDVEVIAAGGTIRKRKRLWKLCGKGRWRKLKGIATIEFRDGTIAHAEVHWYEAHGIGPKTTKSNGSLTDMKGDSQFAVCISNKGNNLLDASIHLSYYLAHGERHEPRT
jgi:hypothetical protein